MVGTQRKGKIIVADKPSAFLNFDPLEGLSSFVQSPSPPPRRDDRSDHMSQKSASDWTKKENPSVLCACPVKFFVEDKRSEFNRGGSVVKKYYCK